MTTNTEQPERKDKETATEPGSARGNAPDRATAARGRNPVSARGVAPVSDVGKTLGTSWRGVGGRDQGDRAVRDLLRREG